MDAPTERTLRRPGRPREFDMDEVLDRAADVFCERGYHATSVSDLSRAVRVKPGSLYKAFRDKREVYLAALERQSLRRGAELQQAVEQGVDGRDKLRRALAFYAGLSCGTTGRLGCLLVASAVALASFDPEIARHVADSMRRREKLLADLLRQGMADGSVASTIDVKATARHLLCLLQGLRVLGKTSANRPETLAVVEVALKVLD